MTSAQCVRIFLKGCVFVLFCTSVQAQSLPPSLRIVILGSSSAAGEGASIQDSAWVWRYASILKQIDSSYEVINFAKRGYTSFHLQANDFIPPEGRPGPDAARNITMALSHMPDAIILNLPSNDASLDMSLVEQSGNFDRIVAKAAAAAVPVWITTTQPRNLSEARRQNLITMKDWIALRYGTRSIDCWTGIAAADGSILPWADDGDGVHLSDPAHALVAERVRCARIPESIGATRTMAVPSSQLDPEMRIYPRPAHDQVSVHVALGTSGEFTLLLYDILGRSVRDVQRGASQDDEFPYTLSLPRLPVGYWPWVLLNGGRVRSGGLSVVR